MAKETKTTKTAGAAAQAPVHDWSQSTATGFEGVNQEDLGIPFLAILQKGSPQIDRDHPDYETKKVDGAEVGDIINTVANVVVASADEPIEVVPCTYQRLYMEWTPREKGGGLVKTHRDANILNECQRNERGQDVLRNGNLVVTTAYFYCIALLDGERTPCVIGLTSTQLKKAKQWLNMMMTLKLAKADGTKFTPPMFSHTYRLSSVSEKNEKGSWRGWKIEAGTMVKDPVLIADSMNYAKRASTQVRAQLNAPPTENDDKL
jgi:hypothetical protein